MKVFISSVIVGFEAFREAAVQAVAALGHTPIRAEDFPAFAATPQEACLQGVRDADVVVLLLGERYGYVQASGLSATHEEYREARERRPVLCFVQAGVQPERPDFWREVQDWAGGAFTASFSSPEGLRDAVTRALHESELANAAGVFDEADAERRALELIPSSQGAVGSGARLVVAVAGGPRQQLLRPVELEDAALIRDLQREALLGDLAVLDPQQGTVPEVRGDALRLAQRDAAVRLDALGNVAVEMAASPASREWPPSLPAIIEEEVQQRLTRALRFAGWILDRVDPVRRITDVVPVAAVTGLGATMWRTRAEHERSPNAGQLLMGAPDPALAALTPRARRRAALAHKANELAEDLIVLLRRQLKR